MQITYNNSKIFLDRKNMKYTTYWLFITQANRYIANPNLPDCLSSMYPKIFAFIYFCATVLGLRLTP